MTSATELIGAWIERDRKYRARRQNGRALPLAENEIEAILFWRNREAETLPADDRDVAYDILRAWTAPVQGR